MVIEDSQQPLVLVVEDEREIRDVLHMWLQAHYHCQVLTAETGEDALHLMQQEPPTLVLMDLILPGIDGFEASQRLRAHPQWSQVPFMAISNECWSAKTQQRVKDEGFIGCVDKGHFFDRLPHSLNGILTPRIHERCSQ